ncbi:MAG: hypothetical protein HZC55_12285 [Verrucomicrobia bacterium]|nr:hypothetical protein [Verrucomicrobiota bacterium]
MIIVFYVGTVIAITTHRIFDARQIVVFFFQKISLIVVVSAIAYSFYSTSVFFVPSIVGFVGTIAVALVARSVLSGWLDRVFEFYPEGNNARQAVLLAAQRGTRMDDLEAAFCGVLRGWGQSEKAVVDCDSGKSLSGVEYDVSRLQSIRRAMRQLRWITPERLARERSTSERADLAEFLRVSQLGVLVYAEGPSLTVLVGVGVGAARRPYTYPQVTQLMELASIMESALERAHFSAKVQRTEQLATVGLVGASLAHEIRNPLVSIKTFVQLLPTHHQDPAFREKFFRLIGSEVDRIDQLTEQLLDLSAPRAYAAVEVALHEVMRSSLELVTAKAADKQVAFSADFSARPDTVFTDPAAAKQVMLNLCFNAIQAVDAHRGEECWVRVATRNVDGGVEMSVSDSGPGIAPEMRDRLFQPFQTTKSTGFGLGLAICRDILANLHASISVDPPVAGKGATFRVTYPCQVSLS